MFRDVLLKARATATENNLLYLLCFYFASFSGIGMALAFNLEEKISGDYYIFYTTLLFRAVLGD